jgi:uncharacterized membrane protein YcaP (DUF421 family)
MFDLGVDWWELIVRGVVVYIALLLGIRMFGRREIGQMTPFDLVLILLIANAVQNAMVGPDTSLIGGLVVAATLLILNRLVARSSARIPWLRSVTEGEPILLINNGRVLADRLRREGIDIDDLEQAAREHGVKDLSEVDTAVLEIDGSVSIIPVTGTKVRTRRRFRQMRHP